MAVTATAAYGQPQQRSSQRAHHIVKLFVAASLPFLLCLLCRKRPRHEKSGSSNRSNGRLRLLGGTYVEIRQKVTGNLETDKLVIRHV